MEAEGVESGEGMARFAPGTAAPTAADSEAARIRKERMAAGREKWNALPKSERARIRAAKKAAREEKAAKKAAKEAEREAKAARRRGAQSPESSGPDTVRSSRLASERPRATLIAPPPSSVPTREPLAVGPVKGLLDLVATMPALGDGTCFIQVTRVKPTVAFGVPCAGVQQPVWGPIDDGEFQAFYGGAEYTLRGYQINEKNGRRIPITELVQYKVPGPPNLDSAATPDEEAPPMQRHQPNGTSHFARRPPVLTPQQASAEAEIHDRDLTHRETMDEREERRRKDREERQRAAQREAERTTLERERLLVEAKDREAERLQASHERQLELERSARSEMAEVFRMMAPRDDGRATAAHAAEIRQLGESHKQEVIRINDQHRDEINRLIQTHADALRRVEDQARADRERSDNLVREAERRAQEQIRQIQSDADRRISESTALARAQYEDLRQRGEERVRDLDAQWQRRFDDLKAAQERELRGKDSEINMMRANLEGNQQVILAGKDSEIKRLHQEVRAAKEEAERNKDWRGRMKEITETAEELGFVKPDEAGGGDGEPEDMKAFAMKAGFQVLQNLPQLIQSGANAIAQMRGGGAPAAATRQGGIRSNMRTVSHRTAPALAPPPQALTFATEDGPAYQPPPGAPPPMQPSLAPLPLTMAQEPVNQRFPVEQPQAPAHFPAAPMLQEPMAALPQASAGAAAAPAAAPSPAASAPVMVQNPAPAPSAPSMPPPSMPPPSMPPPSVASQGLDEQGAMIFGGLAEGLTSGFENRIPPRQVAEDLLKNSSPEMMSAVLEAVSIQNVLTHVNANHAAYPKLASREGQKYLREIWKQCEALAGGAS